MTRTFIEVPLFSKRWKEIGLGEDELRALQIMLLDVYKRQGKRHSCPLYSKSGYVSQTKQRLFQWPGRDQKDQSKLKLCYRLRG